MSEHLDWTEQARRLVAGLSGLLGGEGALSSGNEHAGAGGDCRWCPLCQAAAVMRGERPEVTAALSDMLATASAALRTFAEQGRAASPPSSSPSPEESSPEQAAAPEPSSGRAEPAEPDDPEPVQRIEIA